MPSGYPRFGQWSQPGQTQVAGTAIKIPITPYAGPPGAAPLVYAIDSQGVPNWMRNGAVTHVSQYGITTGTTLHTHYFMRPLNYASVTVAGAVNGTTFTIGTDPGLYSTANNYKYAMPDGRTKPGNIADNAIAANDYFAVQLADGTWFFDKVSSVTALAITTTTTIPNVTGGGIPVGNIMFWFGIQTDTDPATGFGHPSMQPPISVTTYITDQGGEGIVSTLRAGDPMYYINLNATAADTVVMLSGHYSKI